MKTRIFISSTSDLSAHRIFAQKKIEQLGHEPVLWDEGHFQEYGGTPEEQCLKNLESCDILLAIAGPKAGSPSSRLPWTVFQLEVLHALGRGIPVIYFSTRSLGDQLRNDRRSLDKSVILFDSHIKKKNLLIHEIRDENHFGDLIQNKLSGLFKDALEKTKRKPVPTRKIASSGALGSLGQSGRESGLSQLFKSAEEHGKVKLGTQEQAPTSSPSLSALLGALGKNSQSTFK